MRLWIGARWGAVRSRQCPPFNLLCDLRQMRNLSVAFCGTVRLKASFPLTHLANEGATSRGDTAPGAPQGATWTSDLHVDEMGRGRSGLLLQCGYRIPETAGLFSFLFRGKRRAGAPPTHQTLGGTKHLGEQVMGQLLSCNKRKDAPSNYNR